MRRIAYIAVIVLLPVMMFVPSCGGDASVNLIFNQVQGDCASANQSVATIQCDGGVLTFQGSVVTPNPCYYLKASLDSLDEWNFMIAIGADSPPGQDNYCIECVGEVSFDGTVSLAGLCFKKVSIVYNGATIAEYEQQ